MINFHFESELNFLRGYEEREKLTLSDFSNIQVWILLTFMDHRLHF